MGEIGGRARTVVQGYLPALLPVLLLALAGCESAYYGAWEQVGVHKRDILVDRVEDAMESQDEAKEEFQTALERFSSVVEVEPSALKSKYEELNEAFEDAESRAEDVTSRIDAVEDVSEDLFDEWREEISEISNARLRDGSAAQLQSSEQRYEGLIAAMRRAEDSMQPVLTSMRDHVLYLKHNLNAQAIASLQGELASIESDVADLVRDMETSIAEAQRFIDEMSLVNASS